MHEPVPIPSGDALPSPRTAIPGPRSSALCDVLASTECPSLTARRARRAEQTGTPHDPIVWSAARGANVTDVDANVFVDLTAGFGAALLGHGDTRVLEAVRAQADRMAHALGDVYPSEPKIELERRLAALAPWPHARVILGLSGADAVEAALKTAMLATHRAGVLAFEGGYHGLSHGPLAACGYSEAFRRPFAPQLNPHVAFVPYPVAHDANQAARARAAAIDALATRRFGAMLIEPILGRGGVSEPDRASLDAILDAAAESGTLLIADEIYTGLFRTGEAWLVSSARWARAPDVVCIGKSLGGTLPISACVIREEVAAAWGDPSGEAIHTSTFLGNPLASAAALATLDALESPETHARLAECADTLWNQVLAPLPHDPSLGVARVGGRGLLAGVMLEGAPARVLASVRGLLVRGYLVLPCGTSASGMGLSLTPPMTLTAAQIAGFGSALREVLASVRA